MPMARADARLPVVLAGLLASSLWLLGATPPKSGDGPVLDEHREDDDGEIKTDLSVNTPGKESTKPVTPAVSDTAAQDPWTGLPMVGNLGGGGDPCIEYRWVQLPADEIEAAERDAWEAVNYVYSNVPELEGPRPAEDCPADPSDDLPPPLLDDVVRESVTDVLPRPDLSVPPGYALTGMPAYLVTDHALEYGPAEHGVDLEIMQLTVRVTGTGTSTVDWGDGSAPRSYEEPGVPYPDGKVKYTYADKGAAEITVTDHWTLNYDVYRDGTVIISDQVELALDPVTLGEPLEIRELQAVRTSGQ